QGRPGARALPDAPARGHPLSGAGNGAGWTFELGVPGGAGVGVALVLAIAAVAAWGVRDALREARPARRRVLVVLRVLTAVMALLVGLQPRWLTEDLEETEGALAVLFDGSRSMTIGAAGERTRAE